MMVPRNIEDIRDSVSYVRHVCKEVMDNDGILNAKAGAKLILAAVDSELGMVFNPFLSSQAGAFNNVCDCPSCVAKSLIEDESR